MIFGDDNRRTDNGLHITQFTSSNTIIITIRTIVCLFLNGHDDNDNDEDCMMECE